jgi:hypothetical protein
MLEVGSVSALGRAAVLARERMPALCNGRGALSRDSPTRRRTTLRATGNSNPSIQLSSQAMKVSTRPPASRAALDSPNTEWRSGVFENLVEPQVEKLNLAGFAVTKVTSGLDLR